MSKIFKSKKIKIAIISLITVLFLGLAFAFYQKKIRHNLVTISENKVYNSGVIPADQLPGVINDHHIKTIIDLRDGAEQTELNPETKQQVNTEASAAGKISGVHYFNLPTDQIPEDSTVKKFLKIMDDPKNYPVLIHCHHGVGRSRLFSSIYRIEYEHFTNEQARKNARFFWEFSNNFSKNSQKGLFLTNYKKRNH
ncbi:dual specificity protein phosphatase family protein [Chryseobacterium takakiae]|uniref:Tyrosine phosphatase family protein n=1 Tax=Chryseobacterium takakiae TaxID=1302685 RepID=A0A1M4TUU4_9FLAO|nr:dual specificity protein phosphatase family protein [Chryseobacterium takakiae]SHE48077.1 Tyrosine phosphatase family protein [Chryseobacterium takakiae]